MDNQKEKIKDIQSSIRDVIADWDNLTFQNKELFLSMLHRMSLDFIEDKKEKFIEECILNGKTKNENSVIESQRRYYLREDCDSVCDENDIDKKRLYKTTYKNITELRSEFIKEELDLLLDMRETKPSFKLTREKEEKFKVNNFKFDKKI